MLETPVLFLIFNRPDTTQLVFESIKKQKPVKFYIAADGPRQNIQSDQDKCALAKKIVDEGIDWPCEVKTLYRENNLGCGKAVSEAITWFFTHEERGIILEDDCLPDQSFFEFCSTLLEKYANTKEVMTISGTNFLPKGWKTKKQSYHFAHVGIWGWATWKRAWKLYDYNMTTWDNKANKKKIRRAMNNDNWFNLYYSGLFDITYQKKLDTWDAQWVYCILNNGGAAINPSVNLVRNIGFGPDATHTTSSTGSYSNLKAQQIKFPLKHPVNIKVDKKYLQATFKYYFEYDKTFTQSLKSWIRIYLRKITGSL
ncbi:MAG TPA: hypothetical protein VL442_03935 [Mucilaginibacter sp.]|jgi:hypothetical protein|nr:hypothetical protein [Mucilaginibacter sp.]